MQPQKISTQKNTITKANSLVLMDFLYPGETIIYQSGKVYSLDDQFFFFITDQRILLYRRRGALFKKDRIVAERIEDIRTMDYHEQGVVRKRGVLCIETYSKKMGPISGKVEDIKGIWQELQKYIKKDAPE
jgi:hypothetical protein